MNKKFTYPALIILFFGLTAFVVINYNTRFKSEMVAFFPLQQRAGAAAALPEWASIKTNSDKLIRIVRENPDDIKSTMALVSLYIQEGRVTGNHSYYDAAAMKYINQVLEKKKDHFEAMVLKAVIQLSQHHFTEALETADKARAINPYNAFIYGVIVDGNVEMGNYTVAVENSDKMMSIRPDIRSYARVSYLREIHGDYPGAIEAMNMAVEAGAYGDEPTAWSRVQLAHLYELTGDLKAAAMHYTIASEERPGYGYALAGLGRIAMAEKDYNKAIELHVKAIASVSDYAIKEQLAELYLLANQKEKAGALMQQVIKELNAASEEGEQNINHHADGELAYIYLFQQELDKAEASARKEYNRRPDNITVNETMAWVLHKGGKVQEALTFVAAALKTGSKNPVLLCRAGLIYNKAGEKDKAKLLLNEGLRNHPNIDPLLVAECTEVLKSLK
jgi:tetratricopeptide (TPR) repeat protein